MDNLKQNTYSKLMNIQKNHISLIFNLFLVNTILSFCLSEHDCADYAKFIYNVAIFIMNINKHEQDKFSHSHFLFIFIYDAFLSSDINFNRSRLFIIFFIIRERVLGSIFTLDPYMHYFKFVIIVMINFYAYNLPFITNLTLIIYAVCESFLTGYILSMIENLTYDSNSLKRMLNLSLKENSKSKILINLKTSKVSHLNKKYNELFKLNIDDKNPNIVDNLISYNSLSCRDRITIDSHIHNDYKFIFQSKIVKINSNLSYNKASSSKSTLDIKPFNSLDNLINASSKSLLNFITTENSDFSSDQLYFDFFYDSRDTSIKYFIKVAYYEEYVLISLQKFEEKKKMRNLYSKIKTQMVLTIFHELNNPLNGLNYLIDYLPDAQIEEKYYIKKKILRYQNILKYNIFNFCIYFKYALDEKINLMPIKVNLINTLCGSLNCIVGDENTDSLLLGISTYDLSHIHIEADLQYIELLLNNAVNYVHYKTLKIAENINFKFEFNFLNKNNKKSLLIIFKTTLPTFNNIDNNKIFDEDFHNDISIRSVELQKELIMFLSNLLNINVYFNAVELLSLKNYLETPEANTSKYVLVLEIKNYFTIENSNFNFNLMKLNTNQNFMFSTPSFYNINFLTKSSSTIKREVTYSKTPTLRMRCINKMTTENLFNINEKPLLQNKYKKLLTINQTISTISNKDVIRKKSQILKAFTEEDTKLKIINEKDYEINKSTKSLEKRVERKSTISELKYDTPVEELDTFGLSKMIKLVKKSNNSSLNTNNIKSDNINKTKLFLEKPKSKFSKRQSLLHTDEMNKIRESSNIVFLDSFKNIPQHHSVTEGEENVKRSLANVGASGEEGSLICKSSHNYFSSSDSDNNNNSEDPTFKYRSSLKKNNVKSLLINQNDIKNLENNFYFKTEETDCQIVGFNDHLNTMPDIRTNIDMIGFDENYNLPKNFMEEINLSSNPPLTLTSKMQSKQENDSFNSKRKVNFDFKNLNSCSLKPQLKEKIKTDFIDDKQCIILDKLQESDIESIKKKKAKYNSSSNIRNINIFNLESNNDFTSKTGKHIINNIRF